jgi:hypothetical protein
VGREGPPSDRRPVAEVGVLGSSQCDRPLRRSSREKSERQPNNTRTPKGGSAVT